MGLTYHENGLLPEARAEYEKALVIEPDYYEALNNLSEVCLRESDAERAKALLQKAVENDSTRSLAYLNLAKIHLSENRPDSAIENLRHAIAIDDENADTIFAMGRIHFQQRHYKAAFNCFKRVAAIDPRYPGLRYYVGITLAHVGEYEKAAEHLKHAAHAAKTNHHIFNALGTIYYRKGMSFEAAKYFRRAVSVKPDNPVSHVNLAVIYSERKDYDRAIDEYNKYLKYLPNSGKAEKIKNVIGKLEEHKI